jgi:hypothetical protein
MIVKKEDMPGNERGGARGGRDGFWRDKRTEQRSGRYDSRGERLGLAITVLTDILTDPHLTIQLSQEKADAVTREYGSWFALSPGNTKADRMVALTDEMKEAAAAVVMSLQLNDRSKIVSGRDVPDSRYTSAYDFTASGIDPTILFRAVANVIGLRWIRSGLGYRVEPGLHAASVQDALQALLTKVARRERSLKEVAAAEEIRTLQTIRIADYLNRGQRGITDLAKKLSTFVRESRSTSEHIQIELLIPPKINLDSIFDDTMLFSVQKIENPDDTFTKLYVSVPSFGRSAESRELWEDWNSNLSYNLSELLIPQAPAAPGRRLSGGYYGF